MEVNIYDTAFVYRVLRGESVHMEPNGETVTLFWSGGIDSTYLLMWLLSHGYEVHTIYCELKNNKFKVKRENWARNKIREYILDNVPSLAKKWVHSTNPISIIEVPDGNFRPALSQAPLWALNTQFYGRSLPRVYTMAYVNGDDALHWLPAINKIIEGYNMLRREDQPPVEVLYPMTSIKKSWFYGALEPLYGLMTWCEYPRLSRDCKCPACVRHRHELEGFSDGFCRC